MDSQHANSSVFPDGRSADEQPKWRRDFPVDIEADEYGARRDFTKFMVLTSLAFVVGQFWIGLQTLFTRRKWREARVAEMNDVGVGQAISFHYPTNRDPCVLIRLSETDFRAYSSQCTHLMCPVRPEPETKRLHCPCHEGYFDVETGRPTAGPPRRPLPKIHLRVARGAVYATRVEERAT